MGTGLRPPLLIPPKGPGPASYRLPGHVGEGPKILLHGKRPEEKIDSIPGPGTYNPNHKVSLERYPAIALSTGPRVEKDYSTRREVPGPGHYPMPSAQSGPKFG